MEKLQVSDPKAAFGIKKVGVQFVPPVALVYLGMAFMDGARKYGAFNWRKTKVESSTYMGAAMRHMLAWYDGEDKDPDSGNPHIAHAMACMAMIADAQEGGYLEDNRPPKGPAPKVMQEFNKND